MRIQSDTQWWKHDPVPETVQGQLVYADAVEAAPESPLPYWALLAFTFILLMAPQAYYPVLAPLRIALVTAALAVFTHVGFRLSANRPLVTPSKGLTIVFWLVSWAILTVPLSFWPGGSVSFFLDLYIKTVIVFVLLSSVVNTVDRLKGICWALALMAIPLALTTVKNFATGSFLAQGPRVVGTEAGLTGNPNDMALMLNLILPLVAGLALSSKKRLVQIMLCGLICLLVAAIIVTFSRAGFIALVVSFVTYMWRLRNRPQRMVVPLVLLLGLASIPFIPAGYTERVSTITNIEEDETGSAQERWADMQLAVQLVVRNPLIGAGIGMDNLVMDEARGAVGHKIHNVYLQYAVELGVVGLVLFVMLLRVCLKNTAYVTKWYAERRQYDTLFYLAEGIRVSLIAFTVEAFFHPVAYHFYFYYIAGLAVALTTICESEDQKSRLAENYQEV